MRLVATWLNAPWTADATRQIRLYAADGTAHVAWGDLRNPTGGRRHTNMRDAERAVRDLQRYDGGEWWQEAPPGVRPGPEPAA